MAPTNAGFTHQTSCRDGGGQRAPLPADYDVVWQVLAEADNLRAGNVSARGLDTVVALKQIASELFRCVFEVRPGNRNRALALQSLVIKL